MTKQDDLYVCEHCWRYFYIDRVNGKKGSVQYKCKCGRTADKWPDIPEGYGNHIEVKLPEAKCS